jgi:hypothetical protein
MEQQMSEDKQRLREIFRQVEPRLTKVFGSGWKTHTIYGLLENGSVRIETLDGHTPKRMVIDATGKVLWVGRLENDGNRETPKTFKMRSLMRKARIRNRIIAPAIAG